MSSGRPNVARDSIVSANFCIEDMTSIYRLIRQPQHLLANLSWMSDTNKKKTAIINFRESVTIMITATIQSKTMPRLLHS